MEIKMFFPTAVGFDYDVFSDEENQIIVDRCYEINQLNSFNSNTWLSANNSPSNSFALKNLVKDEKLSFMSELIHRRVQEFATLHNDSATYACVNSWFNIYKGGNFQESHTHSYPCMYSAVYYPLAPEGSGEIVFEPPHDIYINDDSIVGDNFLNQKMIVVKPKPKMLVFFKSNLRHFVLPGSNIDDRISIAFNFILDPQYYFDKYSTVVV